MVVKASKDHVFADFWDSEAAFWSQNGLCACEADEKLYKVGKKVIAGSNADDYYNTFGYND